MTAEAQANIVAGLAGPVDPNSYRTFLSLDPDKDVIPRVCEQLSSWLREKKWDAPLDRSGFQTDGRRELMTLHRESADGREFRARLTEPTELGEWRTQLTVHDPRSGMPWVALRVTNGDGRWVDVPRLVGYLMDSLDTRDGEALLSRDLRLVDVNGIEDLMESISDPTRQGLFLVGGTDESGIDVGAFTEQVGRWTRQVGGLAQVVVLTPGATTALKQGLGSSHSVQPWTLRTFYPDVDPAIAADGFRHKYITRRRLATDNDDVIRKLLGRIARRHAETRPAPPGFLKVDRALARLEDGLLLEDLRPEGAPAVSLVETSEVESPSSIPVRRDAEGVTPGAEAYLESIELVKAVLGLSELSRPALLQVAHLAQQGQSSTESIDRVTRQLQKRQKRIDELQDTAAFYQELWEEEQLEERISAEEVSRLADENRWLRKRLASVDDHTAAYGAIPDDAHTRYPSDFADLNDRLAELEPLGIIFTGDPAEMLAIDEHDTLNKLVQVAWDALLALTDYIRARNESVCSTGVKQYLTGTPQGFRSLPPKKFAEKETSITMKAWGDMREFPVPKEVNSSGYAVMEAHFKLGRVGMVSPRMYYLDCWATTRKVYVGYVGAHLRNTHTN